AALPGRALSWGSALRPADEVPELEAVAAPLWRAHGLDMPARAGLYTHALVDPCPPLLGGGGAAAAADLGPVTRRRRALPPPPRRRRRCGPRRPPPGPLPHPPPSARGLRPAARSRRLRRLR